MAVPVVRSSALVGAILHVVVWSRIGSEDSLLLLAIDFPVSLISFIASPHQPENAIRGVSLFFGVGGRLWRRLPARH